MTALGRKLRRLEHTCIFLCDVTPGRERHYSEERLPIPPGTATFIAPIRVSLWDRIAALLDVEGLE